MKKIAYVAALFSCFYLVSSCNNKPANHEEDSVEAAKEVNEEKNVNEKDAKFLVDAAARGMKEVELSRIAVEKSGNPEVKSFAQKMIDDHSQVNDEAKALAANKQITIPNEMSEETKKAIEKLNEKSGINFDKEYMNMMHDDHKDAVDLFENASKDCEDVDIKTFAASKLSGIRNHLEMAEKTHDFVEGKGAKNSAMKH